MTNKDSGTQPDPANVEESALASGSWVEKTQALVNKAKNKAASLPAKDQSATVSKRRGASSKKLTPVAFENAQLTLFQNFLCNTDEERAELSNTMDLWDSVPRYSVSRQTMSKLRSPEGVLKMLKLDFHYRQKRLRAVITPARIEVEQEPGVLVEMDFYPSAAEELVEDALRKIAADQQQGYFDKNDYRSGAVFSLHALRAELKKRGHSRSFQELMLSLRILAKSNIEIIDPEDSGGSFALSSYLPALAGVTRKDLEADPGAKWLAQFHPLVTQSIDQLTYRQFNYHQMMQHSTQLARWLHKQLALKFTFASIGRTFDMRFSTIRRDSALLNGYAEDSLRLAVKAVDDAFAELTPKVLMTVEKEVVRGERNKIKDVVYTLSPSREFVQAMKASNKRLQLAGKELGRNVDVPGSEIR